MASGIVSERKRSKCTVVGSVPERRVSVVAEESMISHSGVANAGDITKECATTDGRISHTFGVVDKSSRSSGRIEAAGRVVQKRGRGNGGVLGSLTRNLISDVEKERSRTHSGVARSKKCFGYGIGERLTSASQHKIPVRFPKQLEPDKFIRFLREVFQLRSGNSVARPQPERDPLRTLHFVRQIFARCAC